VNRLNKLGLAAVALVAFAGALTAPALADPPPPTAEDAHGRTPEEQAAHEARRAETSSVEEDPTRFYNYDKHFFTAGNYDVEGHAKGTPDYDANEPMSQPFVLALVNFAILLFLLAKYGGPVARRTAEERSDQIKNALDEAKKLRDQAADKVADYDKRIANLDSEIEKLVAGLRADADADKARILAAADAQAAQLKRDAELRIAAEFEYARAGLLRDLTVAATKATEQLLAHKLQPADQEKLVATFIADVQAVKPASKPEAKS